MLDHVRDAQLRAALALLDGEHLAAQALLAFCQGAVIRQHNLLSTATDEERRATLNRLISWWNLAAAPVIERLAG